MSSPTLSCPRRWVSSFAIRRSCSRTVHVLPMAQNTADTLHTLACDYLPDEIAERWIGLLRPGPAPGEGYGYRSNRGSACRRFRRGSCAAHSANFYGQWYGTSPLSRRGGGRRRPREAGGSDVDSLEVRQAVGARVSVVADVGVGRLDLRAHADEQLRDPRRRRLAGVSGVGLVGEAEQQYPGAVHGLLAFVEPVDQAPDHVVRHVVVVWVMRAASVLQTVSCDSHMSRGMQPAGSVRLCTRHESESRWPHRCP